MNTIYLPTFPAFRKDVETVLSVLEKEVLQGFPGKFNIGLELGGKKSHFTESEYLESIKKNIKEVAGGAKIIIHGFTGLQMYTEGIADMSKLIGKEVLDGYIKLGKELENCDYIHVHGSVPFQGLAIPEDKSEVLKKVRENLLYGLKNSGGIPIGIENAPTPACWDLNNNPKTVWSDYVEQPRDIFEIIKGTDLNFTFDTCHYAADKKGYIDLTMPVREMEKYLFHIHVSDASGSFVPYISKGGEGSIPGDGRIGRDSFENFFKYIKENHPDVGICTEVNNRDFKNPVEFREAIKRVCEWLS